jgi:hypothetical protein
MLYKCFLDIPEAAIDALLKCDQQAGGADMQVVIPGSLYPGNQKHELAFKKRRL